MQTPPLRFPDELSRERFLDEFWQKKPALVRNAFPTEIFNLTPDELAGLACEETIESRLIRESEENKWSLQQGPFDTQDFSALPDSRWTLLVQDVDKYLPDVSMLLDAFDFLPDWRIDDIMISYASDQGGVGPHTDSYDVFLVQTHGQRRWRISERRYTEADLMPDSAVKVLRDFETNSDLTLHPGDMLYLPPNVAHWGMATGECMTWSVGMRGPCDSELLAAWLEHISLHSHRAHLTDRIDSGTPLPSLIEAGELADIRTLMARLLPDDDPTFRHWAGCYLTEPKPGFEILPEETDTASDVRRWQSGTIELRRHPWARFALVPLNEGGYALCSQGQSLTYPSHLRQLLERICASRQLTFRDFSHFDPTHLNDVISDLLERGWLHADE